MKSLLVTFFFGGFLSFGTAVRLGERSYFLANAKNDDDVARASSSNFDLSPNTSEGIKYSKQE